MPASTLRSASVSRHYPLLRLRHFYRRLASLLSSVIDSAIIFSALLRLHLLVVKAWHHHASRRVAQVAPKQQARIADLAFLQKNGTRPVDECDGGTDSVDGSLAPPTPSAVSD